MTEFETSLLSKLDNLAEVFSSAMNTLSEEQKIINKYNIRVQLKMLQESEYLTDSEKAAFKNELDNLVL